MNVILLLLLSVLGYLQYRLWFEPGGIRDMQKFKIRLMQQAAENEKYKQRNDELLFQIQRLQHSNDAAESRARNELGMVKKDEVFYQIVKQDKKDNT